MALVTTQRGGNSKDQYALTVSARTSSILAHPRYTLTPNLSAGAAATSPVTSTDMSPDGRLLVSSAFDGKIYLWVRTPAATPAKHADAASSATRRHFVCVASYTMKAAATRVKFAGANSNLIVASLACGVVAVIDIESGKVERQVRPPRPDKIVFQNAVVLNDVAVAPPEVSPDCKCIATCGDDGRVTIFDLRVATTNTSGAKCFQTPVPQTAICFTPSAAAAASASASSAAVGAGGGIGIFTGGVDGSLRWLQLNGGEIRCAVECLDAHDDVITGLAANPNCSTGVVLSYSSFAHSVRVHDLRPWSQDSKHVVFEDADVFGKSAGAAPVVVDRSLLRCAFSPNGTSFAVGTPFGAVAVYENWQDQQQQQQQRDRRRSEAVAAAAASCKSRFYVTPHASSVTDVVFHPQSDQCGEIVLATSSIDGTCVVACA